MFDRELIERVASGDKKAFKELFYYYKNKIYKTACFMVNDSAASEDIVQEVFIVIYTKIYKLKHPEAFETWIYRITVNCCYSYLKHHKVYDSLNEEVCEKLIEDKIYSPESITLKQEMQVEIMKYIYELSNRQRACIILYYFNEFSIREVADIMECSEGTVKSTLFQSKRLLEKKLSQNMCGGEAYGFR